MRNVLCFTSAFTLLLLGGCASLRSVDSDVSTFSQWPAQRAPATYAFDRLPSQQARPEQQQALEEAARPAIAKAGFLPAADAALADFSIQIGARITPNDRSPFDDPFWWRGGLYRGGWYGYGASGYGGYGHGHFGRPFWGAGWDTGYYGASSYEREVALLIRDRKTGQTLYETRASNDGLSPLFGETLPAMFGAALQDFPSADATPRRVSIELPKAP